MKEKLERITLFTPAFDKRNPDPKIDYGISALQCHMILKGKKGVAQFIFSTGILLPETVEEYIETGRARYEKKSYGVSYLTSPMGYDVGFHSPKPTYKGQEPMQSDCQWLKVKCYYDGSSLRAEEFLDVLIRQGSEKIWEMLEEDYKEIFK